MIEIHSWITLRYDDYESNEQEQRAFVERFKAYLQENYADLSSSPYIHLHTYNGMDCFSLHTQHNHRGEDFYPLKILQWVAREGKGSYGLLYFHDDEDKEQDNVFQVYSLKRGRVAKQQDSFLSPYFPGVEKEYEPNNPPKD